MDTDLQRGCDTKLLHRAETEKIIGVAFEVPNVVGHGLNEKIYENSLKFKAATATASVTLNFLATPVSSRA